MAKRQYYVERVFDLVSELNDEPKGLHWSAEATTDDRMVMLRLYHIYSGHKEIDEVMTWREAYQTVLGFYLGKYLKGE